MRLEAFSIRTSYENASLWKKGLPWRTPLQVKGVLTDCPSKFYSDAGVRARKYQDKVCNSVEKEQGKGCQLSVRVM